MVARSVALIAITFTALFVWNDANSNWKTPEYGITGPVLDEEHDVLRTPLADSYCMDLTTYQELDALPLPIADVYYEGKLNSDGCVPSMSFTGFASVTDPAPFLVEAQDVTAASYGVLVFGVTPAMVPFESGFLCVGQPQFQSKILYSGGTGACGGTFSFNFNKLIQGAADPASLVGVQIFTQYGYLDAGDPFGSGLTNGLRFTIQP